MRVGFCGAGGTGKTTTAELLKDKLGLPFIPSVARDIFKRRGLTEASQRAMTVAEKLDLQDELFTAREKQIKENPNGIYDRTSIDNLAYCTWRCEEGMSEQYLRDKLDRCKASCDLFDHIFYFPLYSSAKWQTQNNQDGFREDHYTGRFIIDSLVLGIIERMGIRATWVENGPTQDRAEFVLKVATSSKEHACRSGVERQASLTWP